MPSSAVADPDRSADDRREAPERVDASQGLNAFHAGGDAQLAQRRGRKAQAHALGEVGEKQHPI